VRRHEGGFTLAEVLVAAVIVTSGLAGITAMLQLSAYSVREGRYRSVAIFLAEERAEQIRGVTWGAGGDCLGVSPSPAMPPVASTCPGAGADHVPFPDERAGTLGAPFEPFTRTVRVQTCASPGTCSVASPDLRLVTIAISYGSTSGIGGSVGGGFQTITLRGLVAKRF